MELSNKLTKETISFLSQHLIKHIPGLIYILNHNIAFPNVTHLKLCGIPIPQDALFYLLSSTSFPKLVHLNLRQARCKDLYVKVLRCVQRFPNLVYVYVTGNHIKNEYLLELAYSKNFSTLKVLRLASHSNEDRGIYWGQWHRRTGLFQKLPEFKAFRFKVHSNWKLSERSIGSA